MNGLRITDNRVINAMHYFARRLNSLKNCDKLLYVNRKSWMKILRLSRRKAIKKLLVKKEVHLVNRYIR